MARHNEEWEATKAELYAEEWWKKHGFSVKLLHRFLSKSVYEVSKDGITSDYEIPFRVTKPKEFMDGFAVFWETLRKLNP